jgi:hypothetical protein
LFFVSVAILFSEALFNLNQPSNSKLLSKFHQKPTRFPLFTIDSDHILFQMVAVDDAVILFVFCPTLHRFVRPNCHSLPVTLDRFVDKKDFDRNTTHSITFRPKSNQSVLQALTVATSLSTNNFQITFALCYACTFVNLPPHQIFSFTHFTVSVRIVVSSGNLRPFPPSSSLFTEHFRFITLFRSQLRPFDSYSHTSNFDSIRRSSTIALFGFRLTLIVLSITMPTSLLSTSLSGPLHGLFSASLVRDRVVV